MSFSNAKYFLLHNMGRGIFIIMFLAVISMTGCGGAGTVNNNVTENIASSTEQTEYINPVPSQYFRDASNKGSVVIENYKSYDYTLDNPEEITKTAYVYLPYGYDPDDSSKRYDVFYLVHGWTMTAGDFFNDSGLVSMFDNMIQNGDIPPVIVVCATFDAENKYTELFTFNRGA